VVRAPHWLPWTIAPHRISRSAAASLRLNSEYIITYYTYLYNIIIPKLTVSGGLKEEAMAVYIYRHTAKSRRLIYGVLAWRATPYNPTGTSVSPFVWDVYIYLHLFSAPQVRNKFWLYIFTGRRAIVIYRGRSAVIVRHYFFNFQISISKYFHSKCPFCDPMQTTTCTGRQSKNTWLMHR